MFPSLRLGRVFGIPLNVHWTFWILPLLVVLSQPGETPIFFHLAVLFAIFGCVVLHELGHALAARLYGIRTRDITLYPIGGIASLERISEKPAEELVIALAGPAVNVVILGILFPLTIFATALAPATYPGTIEAQFLGMLIFANVVMVGFNMIPAFPLDGGRVLRALLGFSLGHLPATRVAVRVGTVMAILLGLAPLIAPLLAPIVPLANLFSSPFLIVIAFLVYSAGRQELAILEQRERLRHTAGQFGAEPTMVMREFPAWMQPTVTVYVWDPRNGVWVRQERS